MNTEFKLVKGVSKRLEDYREVPYNSRLYDTYFTDSDRLNDQLHKATTDGDPYMAMGLGDEAAGIMYMTRNDMAGLPYLNLLSVKRKCRGKEISTDLVEIFIGVMERKQCPSMYIMTSQFNIGVKRLYWPLGFQPRCLLHDAPCKGMSEWLFVRPNRKLA